MRLPYQDYDYLKRSYPDSFANSLKPKGDLTEDIIYHMLLSEGQPYDKLRERVNECLCFAYSLDLVDKNLTRRLQSKSWTRFDETICELKIGLVFRDLDFSVAPVPRAKGNRTGEWLVSKNGFQLFVEVKTPNPPEALLDSGRALRHALNVRRALPAVTIAGSKPLAIYVIYYPGQLFSPDAFDTALNKAIERFEQSGEQELIEEGKNFFLRIVKESERRGISFIPLGARETPTTQSSTGSIKEKLIDIIRKAQRRQDMPSIVVLNDRSQMFNPSILMGEKATNHDTRPLWGSSNAPKHASLSAVGVFWEPFPAGDQTLTIYHHPAPARPVPSSAFQPVVNYEHLQIIQYYLQSDGWQVFQW